jgi:hypothetical protein
MELDPMSVAGVRRDKAALSSGCELPGNRYQSRHFSRRGPAPFALPRSTDMLGVGRHASSVPADPERLAVP